ncbi:hypothetical protein AVP43_02705 [Geobacillus stearothermophilus]|uniref:hypothetical protein n=1 Tax=Geobacillus sp. DSP4a TaxID=2508873 RepID=UPI00067CA84C|nr:hypothetical protein [Geobacillus sp. DSP4a]AKU25284.1 hypothetical protein IB49_00805 [Geobacillus sp. LC300]KZE94415.1 hypothetical protein AVP43_02705 [Geobacillus stearothermophilus]
MEQARQTRIHGLLLLIVAAVFVWSAIHPATQWDMVCTLIGTLIALWLLSRWHDRQLARLNER